MKSYEFLPSWYCLHTPDSSVGEESTCNVGDLGSIPGLGRSPGEGKDYHSSILAWRTPWTPWGHNESDTIEQLSLSLWASLVAQMVKNLPAMQETRVHSLGWEDPLEKGMATYSSILA